MPILCRINASDDIEGGQTIQDAAAVAAYLVEECGVNALHVSRAVHVHDEFMWAPGAVHGGFSAPLVEEIKRAVDVPIITVGVIRNRSMLNSWSAKAVSTSSPLAVRVWLIRKCRTRLKTVTSTA